MTKTVWIAISRIPGNAYYTSLAFSTKEEAEPTAEMARDPDYIGTFPMEIDEGKESDTCLSTT